MFACSTYEAKNQIRKSEGYRFLNPQSSAIGQIVSLHSGSFKADALYVSVCQHLLIKAAILGKTLCMSLSVFSSSKKLVHRVIFAHRLICFDESELQQSAE